MKKYLYFFTLILLCCSKADPDILEKVIGNLCLMLKSDVVPVVKKVILSMAALYRVALQVSSGQV